MSVVVTTITAEPGGSVYVGGGGGGGRGGERWASLSSSITGIINVCQGSIWEGGGLGNFVMSTIGPPKNKTKQNKTKHSCFGLPLGTK